MFRRDRNAARSRRVVVLGAAGVLGGWLAGVVPASSPVMASPPGGLQTIPLESVQEHRVELGSLASRSQRKPVSIAGISPYTVTGTDSITGETYRFVTDVNYSGPTAYGFESDQRALSSELILSSEPDASYDGRNSVMRLSSETNCASADPVNWMNANFFDGKETYCSVFGPEVYSQAFTATSGQAVSFDWAASGAADNYEIYAYLVEVNETSPGEYDYGSDSSHTLLAYGRGGVQSWKTTSATVAESGTYRFRFVNGSYDGSGGLWVGADLYIDSVVRVGSANPITFAQPGDHLLADGTVALTASAAAAGPVTFSSLTPSVCSVSGATVTLNAIGVCSIVADHAGDGVDYVPADSVTRSFTVLASAVAPTNSGLPLILGPAVDGGVVTLDEGTWGDGGSPITSTSILWQSTTGGTTTDLTDITGPGCVLVASPGSTLTVTVTMTNGVGSTPATSVGLADFTCEPTDAPVWTDDALAPFVLSSNYNDGVAASALPAATYRVSAGSLPAGLTLDAATGAITGTPTIPGAYDVTIEATNGIDAPIALRFTGTIAAATSPTLTVGLDRSAGQPAAGAPSVISGTGLRPGSTVQVSLDGVLIATGTVGDDGTVTFDVELPADLATGSHDLALSGIGADGLPVSRNQMIVVDWHGSLSELPSDAGYTGVEPRRVLDTRHQQGKLAAGETRHVPVGTDWGVPSDAVSVVLNVTATDTEAPGYLTVYPCGGELPNASAVNYLAGQSVPNLMIVAVGDLHEICVYSYAAAHLVIDLNGYFSPDAPAKLAAHTPTRLLDTRTSARLEAGQAVEIQVTGEGLAAKGAQSAVLNVAADGAAADGYLTVYPCGQQMPLASNVNFRTGETVGNQVFAALSDTGSVCVYASAATHVVVDLDASFLDGATPQLVTFVPVRVLDTRSGVKVQAGQTIRLEFGGADGIAGATAFALNTTIVDPEAWGYLTVYACDGELPLASSMNFHAGRTTANHTTAMADASGSTCIYTSATTNIVIDVEGAYI